MPNVGTRPRLRSFAEERAIWQFDRMGLEWEYEPDRYTLPNGEGYVPDFWLPRIGYYVEVKSAEEPVGLHKPLLLQNLLDERVGNDQLRVVVINDEEMLHSCSGDEWCSTRTSWAAYVCGHWVPDFVDCGNFDVECRHEGCRATMNGLTNEGGLGGRTLRWQSDLIVRTWY